MRIAIVDDQNADREELLEMLEQYFSVQGALAEYSCFCSGEAFLDAFDPGGFQIIFLDIYMGGADGMTVARKIREQDKNCRLVFFTTSGDHAVSSYGVRASYYLTKPTSYELLCEALEVCTAGLLADSKCLETQAAGMPLRVLLQDIFYADCQNKAVVLHTASGSLAVSDSFGQVSEKLLADPRFYPSCRGVVVNLDWVEGMPEGEFLLKNGERVPVRQRGRAEARQAFLARSMRDLLDAPAKR